MAVRATQQVVEVGYDTTPQARVTALVAEVIVEPVATARVTALALEVIVPTAGIAPPPTGGARSVVFVLGG